jgi:glycosyltransferase involved in cell wall biosynthesis
MDLGREMRGGQWQSLALAAEMGADAVLLARAGSPLLAEARRRGVDAREFSVGALMREQKWCDLLHAHDAKAHMFAALVARKPLVVARRVAFPLHRSALSQWKYSRASGWIAVSRHVRDVLVRGGIPKDKISVVYDGVDLPADVATGSDVVAIDTDDPQKGKGLLMEAAELGGFVVKFSKNIVEDLKSARLFVYLTYSEGLGSAALLAMAAGVPVVASDVGGLPEVVLHAKTGYLTENEPAKICSAVREALLNHDELAKQGREMVAGRFSTACMAKDTIDVYKGVLACSSR